MAKKRGHGEGSIYQRSDGLWVGTITIGYSADGKRIRRTIYGDTKRDATQQLTRLQGMKLDGTLTATDQTKVGDYLDGWIATDSKLAPTTRLRYANLVKNHINPRIGGLKVSAVTAATVEALLRGLKDGGASADTCLYAYSVLHRGFQRLVKQRRIVIHPCAGVDRPRVERLKRSSLEPAQVEDLLEAAKDHRLRAVFMLAVTSGMRQGEIFGLQWEDVDLDSGVVTVKHTLEEVAGKLRLKLPKSQAGLRSVKLPQIAVEALRERWALAMQEDAAGVPFVFCDTDGNPLRKSNFMRRVWDKMVKAANLPKGFRFHDLRHSSASLLLKAGVNVKVVSERLGHADVRLTLNTYSHVLKGMDAAAADAFDVMLTPKSANGHKLATNGEESTPLNDKATSVTRGQS